MKKDLFIAHNGKKIARADLEDPQKPGFVKAGIWPLPPSMFLAACHFGLKNHRGQSLALVQPQPDPLSAKTLRSEAPEALRLSLEDAERQLAEAGTLTLASFKQWRSAMNEIAAFDRHIGPGMELTEAGVEKRKGLLREVEDAEKNFRRAEDVETAARTEKARADAELQRWVNEERARRREAVNPKPAAATLSEQLTALRQKITG
jgi:hypothetical protein